MTKKRLLLVGWDSADWKLINPLMDAGAMPALEGLVNSGTSGNLTTLEPQLSPMLWTSIATGKMAYLRRPRIYRGRTAIGRDHPCFSRHS
jgi:predicted AlkP superfamily phosphohydrolase/phosphomutase